MYSTKKLSNLVVAIFVQLVRVLNKKKWNAVEVSCEAGKMYHEIFKFREIHTTDNYVIHYKILYI